MISMGVRSFGGQEGVVYTQGAPEQSVLEVKKAKNEEYDQKIKRGLENDSVKIY